MKLEIAMLVGPEAKQFLVDMTKSLDRMERLLNEKSNEAAPKTASNRRVKTIETSFDDNTMDEATDEKDEPSHTNSDDAPEEIEEEDVIETKSLKAKKAKKVTSEDVNKACKAAVARFIEDGEMDGADARKKVLTILKKQFGVSSVSELEDDQYADVIEAMN